MLVKTCPAKIKAAGEADGLTDGQFEAIVSVFGNVDSVGDRVMPGAFKATLAEWAALGDPIPVIWSHRWDDPEMHVGRVLEAEERAEGLWVRAEIDLEDDAHVARQVNRLLKGRRVTQFSFAYDVDEAADVTTDGVTVQELRKLTLYEVGPTLLGANQETELLAAKSLDGLFADVAAHLKAGRPSDGTTTALRNAFDRIIAGITEVKTVLADLDIDDGKATAPDPAKSQEPSGAKLEEPAGPSPATVRLLADIQLA